MVFYTHKFSSLCMTWTAWNCTKYGYCVPHMIKWFHNTETLIVFDSLSHFLWFRRAVSLYPTHIVSHIRHMQRGLRLSLARFVSGNYSKCMLSNCTKSVLCKAMIHVANKGKYAYKTTLRPHRWVWSYHDVIVYACWIQIFSTKFV